VDSGERRLAAIVVADVVGYSAMMAEDEDGTLSALRAHRNAIDPVILNNAGRIVKGTGDGVLLEFPSAVAALNAAVEVQDLMRERNKDLPESRQMQFRIGINVGDIVIDDTGDVFGDGVNVAARIESVADPGGVSITNAAFEAVRDKVDVEFADDGEHDLKNIPRPVRVWKVGSATSTPPLKTKPAKRALATVAVLPFDNMSDDPEQEYFADGIAEDLLTALSYDQNLAVVARNSTFAFKGRAGDIRSVARELDATHVVEGSVRKAGSRVRVTAQLIDAETGHHIWAERYDRDLVDIFELQDELVDSITAKLRPAFWETAETRRATLDSKSVDAWDLTIQGQFQANTRTLEGFLKGVKLFDSARELEPTLVAPVAGSAEAWLSLAFFGWRSEDVNPWEKGLAAAEDAYRLDPNNYGALVAVSAAKIVTGSPDEGAKYARRAIEINPHAANGYHFLALSLTVGGKPQESIPASTQAWRLSQYEHWHHDTANDLAYSHYLIGNYEAALTWGQQSLHLFDDFLQVHIVLAATYAQLGRTEEGQQHVEAVLRARPDFSCAKHKSRLIYTREEHRDHIIDGLLKAGLPE
jgi:adenylate cyclase